MTEDRPYRSEDSIQDATAGGGDLTAAEASPAPAPEDFLPYNFCPFIHGSRAECAKRKPLKLAEIKKHLPEGVRLDVGPKEFLELYAGKRLAFYGKLAI